jgi:TNF receptor-associated protein 1
MEPSAVSEEMHLDFYRYVANAYDKPYYSMQFRTDAPLEIKALFYFPERHMEKYGMGRSEPGVSLYCRKVLIQHKSTLILPEWLRFVKGVVDSEDIPLNISRENMQDSGLIKRMNTVLTKRVIKFLVDQAKADRPKYLTFWKEFGNFIKEGVCSDFTHKGDVAQLLRFDTSMGEATEQSLDDYVSRMPVDQEQIYYLCAPNREFALASPYFESFDKDGIEVLILMTLSPFFLSFPLRHLIRSTLANTRTHTHTKHIRLGAVLVLTHR